MDLITIWVGLAIISGIVAQSRGRNGFGWFLLGLLVSGLLSLILVALLPSLKTPGERVAEERAQRIQAADTKVCPRCAETVKRAALVCRFCGNEFPAVEKTAVDAYVGNQPRVGNHAIGRPTGRGSYNGINYITHGDGLIVARIGDTPYTWQSAPDFERWTDAHPHLLARIK